MKPSAMAAWNVMGAVALASAFYWFGPDHTLWSLAKWAVFFFAGLVQPMRWSGQVEAELARLTPPVSPGLRRAALYPVQVGLMMLCAGLLLLP